MVARAAAKKNLVDAVRDLSENPIEFSLQPLQNSDTDFEKITSQCKVYFSMFAQCTVEIKEILRVICPSNKIEFFDKGTKLTSLAPARELFRTVKMGNSKFTCVQDVFKSVVDDINVEMYKFYQYAKPDEEGKKSLVIADVLLGRMIEAKEGDDGEGPVPYWAYYQNQVMLKYVVNLEARKIIQTKKLTPFFDVPDCVNERPDGVHYFDLRVRSPAQWRDASDPFNDILIRVKSMYEGGITQRQTYPGYIPGRNQSSGKKPIAIIGVVVCHDIWRRYEERRKDFREQGGEEIWGYHATRSRNVAGIAKENLDPNRRPTHGRAYGDGSYFSEYPEFSAKYDRQCMFVFKLLLLPSKHQKVNRSAQGYCEQIIIQDNSLFKPVFVLLFD